MPSASTWRYSLRWGIRHRPCPGAFELAAAVVPAGAACPPEVEAPWRPGAGYFVTIDFEPPAGAARRWSNAAKARVRQRNLAARLQCQAPLFAAELFARETARRPCYYAGENVFNPSSTEVHDAR